MADGIEENLGINFSEKSEKVEKGSIWEIMFRTGSKQTNFIIKSQGVSANNEITYAAIQNTKEGEKRWELTDEFLIIYFDKGLVTGNVCIKIDKIKFAEVSHYPKVEGLGGEHTDFTIHM
jgi:hypothetical protein